MYLGKVYGECVTREGPVDREGAPLMVSRAFAFALPWMHIRIRCSIIQVPLPEVNRERFG